MLFHSSSLLFMKRNRAVDDTIVLNGMFEWSEYVCVTVFIVVYQNAPSLSLCCGIWCCCYSFGHQMEIIWLHTVEMENFWIALVAFVFLRHN